MVGRFYLALPFLATAAPLAATHTAGRQPDLYVYQGAGCSGAARLPQFEALVGRRVDGVVDFNDYTQTAENAASNMDWLLGCWQRHAPNIAVSIGLAFKDSSTGKIAAGGQDAVYARMGRSLVAHGFSRAYIRLGWEENGGWYPWGRTGPVFAAAFDRVARILKGTPGAKFIVLFNPAAGLPMDKELPTAQDGIALDEYANSWNAGGATTEPGLWQGNLNGWWGINTLGRWPRTDLPTAVPEFGVGSRNDGHGACAGKGTHDCDDPFYMREALAQAIRIGAQFIGYWDYDAGDYNSRISDGARPHQTAAFIAVYGSPAMKVLFAGGSGPFTTSPPPRLDCDQCHATAYQIGPRRWVVPIWAQQRHTATLQWSGPARSAELYDPIGAKPKLLASFGPIDTARFDIGPKAPRVLVLQQ